MKIIQKFLLTFAALALICVLTPGMAKQASAAEAVTTGSCGDNVTYTLYDDGELVISGSGAMKDYSLSYSEPWLDSYSYDASTPWYDHRGSIKKVTIESGVTTIGAYAFPDCSDLTSVNISGSVTSINESAFYGCSGLASIVIPSGVTSIDSFAFSDCIGLTSITIPSSVTNIGVCAFLNCFSLTELYIDDFKTWSEAELYFNPFEANDNPHKLFVGGKSDQGY